MEQISGLIVLLLLICWLLPIVVITIITAVRNAIQQYWHDRGLETGGFYCSNCRFDQRGAMDPVCSECGKSIGELSLLVPSFRPPLGNAAYALVYVAFGFAPMLVVLILIGAALPFNYELYRSADLDVHYPKSGGFIGTIWLQARSRDGFGSFGDAGTVSASLEISLLEQVHQHDSQAWPHDVRVNWRDEQAVGKVFDEMYAFLADDGDDAETRRAWADFLATCQAVGRGERPAGLSSSAFKMASWYEDRRVNAHPLYVAGLVFASLAWLVCLVLFGLRYAARLQLKHAQSRSEFYEQFESIISENRAKMDLRDRQ